MQRSDCAGGDLVKLSFVTPELGSKSSFRGNEDTISDWALFVFDSNGTAVKTLNGSSDHGDMELYVPRGFEYNFFILANLADTIEDQGGYKALADMNQEEFEKLSFKVTPCYKADCIAMAWVQKKYVAQRDAYIPVKLKRLYAKYILSISRENESKSEISIKSVVVRQSKNALYPFRESDDGYREDVGDYAAPLDIAALNRGESIALYIPQNIVNLDNEEPLIEDQWDKDIDILTQNGYEDFCSKCTYLEITADYSLTERISPSQLRYFNGKTATWRFILGGNSTSSFNITGNTTYYLSLQLTDQGVFRNCWRASLNNYTGSDYLLRWENEEGDARAANSIETVYIETASSRCAVYPKLVIDGVYSESADINVSFPPSSHIIQNGKGYIISGWENMLWQTFTMTALWADTDGNTIESDLKVKIRPSNIGIEPLDNNNTQTIIF